MLKIENVEVLGWEHAIRGMRNPKNSWDRSDTTFFDDDEGHVCSIGQGSRLDLMDIGPNDHNLMTRLAAGGPVHAKYRRMITVYLDITAPLYWWKEFDTYKVGTVANSCSTMHKIHDKEFTLEDFSTEHLVTPARDHIEDIIRALNSYRSMYLNWSIEEPTIQACFNDDKKNVWWQMIQLLPSSYNQKRTIMLNYEVLANIYQWRRNHKLDEWHVVCDWIESLPYSELITGKKENENESHSYS